MNNQLNNRNKTTKAAPRGGISTNKIDFVQKRKDRPDAELVDVPALRGACTAATRCTLFDGVALRCNVWTRRPNAHRTPTHSSVQPIERITPGRPRTRHTFPHRPMPVLALARADTTVCGDCRLRCSALPLRRRNGRRCVGPAESTQAGPRRASGSASVPTKPCHAIQD